MTSASLITLVIALASAPALGSPRASQPPRVGRLAQLSFAPGSAVLPVADSRTRRRLGDIAAWAMAHPEAVVIVDGHADRRGTSPRNAVLSLARARGVRDRLVELGVSPDQIVVAAYGEQGAAARREVIVWGTDASIDATGEDDSPGSGRAATWRGPVTPEDRRRPPGVVARRR